MQSIVRHAAPAQQPVSVQPLRFIPALGYFIIPGLLMFFSVNYLMPALHAAGLSALNSYLIAYALPLMGLLLSALIIYTTTDNPLTLSGFRARYRLRSLTRRDGVLIGLALVAQGTLTLMFSRIDQWLVQVGVIVYPPIVALSDQANAELVTQGAALLPAIALLAISVLAEELWFRGYILPRQIAAYGETAWLQNWVLWWLFMHLFKWWGLFTILPSTAIVVYLAMRTQNTTATVVMHYIGNAFSLLPTVLLVMNLI